MKKLLKEFRDLASKGNMFDLAVGVIIGGAFNGLVSSLVSNIIMPVLTLITGKIDFSNMFIALNGGTLRHSGGSKRGYLRFCIRTLSD